MSAPWSAGHGPVEAAALPERERPAIGDEAIAGNRAWEIDRALLIERSERRAWAVAIAGMVLGLLGIAAVFVQGPLRRVVEIPIVVDRVTGETTIQQRLTIDPTGKFLYSLNQRADNVATFRFDASGVPKFTGKFLAVGAPAVMVFLP